MKILKNSVMLFITLLIGTSAYGAESDSLGEIGDNLDLHAVLDAFKNSESLESFEKTMNDKNSKINNLDLNEDGEVDYIQVIDNVEGDAHAIILRIDLAENESQDVAVIEIEKAGDATVNVQIVGDEEIYGKNYFVEPIEETKTTDYLMRTDAVILINVWHWSSIRYIYGPKYVRWSSPYKWHKYPNQWKAWKPYQWNTYHNFHKRHRQHYHITHVHHGHIAHKVYYKHRKTCVRIKTHHKHHSHNSHQGHKANSDHKTNKVKKNKKVQNQKANPHKNTSPAKKGGKANKGSSGKKH
jgi:hypothetical protein